MKQISVFFLIKTLLGFVFDEISTCSCIAEHQDNSIEALEKTERDARSEHDADFNNHFELIVIIALCILCFVFFLMILSLVNNINNLRKIIRKLQDKSDDKLLNEYCTEDETTSLQQ